MKKYFKCFCRWNSDDDTWSIFKNSQELVILMNDNNNRGRTRTDRVMVIRMRKRRRDYLDGRKRNPGNNVQKSITDVEQSIEKIDALGTGMREAVQKAANTIRVFANKPEKEYGEKKFSKIELIKKPLQAKRKLLCGILGYADAAIENVEKLSADVKQYQSERTG